MESGARGCEIVVSGKLRGQRAKAMKFVDGLMIHSGEPVNQYVQRAVKHVELRQGVLGIKVKIMLNYDPAGKQKHLQQKFQFLSPYSRNGEHSRALFNDSRMLLKNKQKFRKTKTIQTP